MRSEHRKLVLAAALILATPLAWSQDGNPYVLNIDRTPYRLALPGTGATASAAAGASRPAPVEPERQARSSLERQHLERIAELEREAAMRSSGEESFRLRERDYEQRIGQLVRERDAWKQRSDALIDPARARP